MFRRTRNYGMFDPAEPLVAGRQMTLLDAELKAGDDISMDVDAGIRRRLWMVEHAHYKRDWTPTPELADGGADRPWMAEADGVTVTEGENGWYLISAAWLPDGGVNVHGVEQAEVEAASIREEGDTKGVTYAHSGGGWFEVRGPGLDEPLKMKGEAAAKEKAAELRAKLPPSGGAGGGDDSGG